jgi:nucleotide-binding universal stress UspA family protein
VIAATGDATGEAVTGEAVTGEAVTGEAAEAGGYGRILLASEGRAIPRSAIERVVQLARPGARVRVLSIARVHGVGFALPAPGLMPNKRELQEQREIVSKAIARLKRKGLEADGHVLGTRKATKRICEEASLTGSEAIVMAADPNAGRIRGDMMWTQEPQRVRRRAKVPVFLVTDRD